MARSPVASVSSRESQATGRSEPAAHSLTRVVLPNPAGAETSVSLSGRLALIRSIRRGRCTSWARCWGAKSLVARIGEDIPTIMSPPARPDYVIVKAGGLPIAAPVWAAGRSGHVKGLERETGFEPATFSLGS